MIYLLYLYYIYLTQSLYRDLKLIFKELSNYSVFRLRQAQGTIKQIFKGLTQVFSYDKFKGVLIGKKIDFFGLFKNYIYTHTCNINDIYNVSNIYIYKIRYLILLFYIYPDSIREIARESYKTKNKKKPKSLFIHPQHPIIFMFSYHHLLRDNDHHSLGKLALFQGS